MGKRLEKLDSLIEVLNNQHRDLRISNSYNLLNVFALMHKLFDNGYRKTGLNRTQIMILSYLLAKKGKTTPSELINKVDRSDNAVSKSLDNLDNLGLTKSTRSKTDRRVRCVSLTEKGLDKAEEFLPIRSKLFRKATRSLTREEGEQLQTILQKISNDLLSVIDKKPKRKEKKFYF